MYGIISMGIITLVIAISALFGLVRKSVRAKLRCVSVILSAISAFVVTLILKNNLSALVETYLLPWLNENMEDFAAQVNDLLTTSPTLIEVGENLVLALVAPIVFSLLFTVFNFLAWLIYFVVTLCLSGKIKEKKQSRWLGSLYGALQGAVLVAIVMLPITCYMEIAIVATDAAADAGLTDDAATINAGSVSVSYGEIRTFASDINRMPTVSLYRNLGGGHTYELLTSVKVRDENVRLITELDSLAKFGCDVVELVKVYGDGSVDGAAKAGVIRTVTEDFEHSDILPVISGEAIYCITDKWSKGESFFGYEKPDMGEQLNVMIDDLVCILHDSSQDEELFIEDISTATEILAILMEYEIMENSSDVDAMLHSISNGNIVSDMITALGSNVRMRVLVGDITTFGMHTVAVALGIPGSHSDVYSDFINDVALALNDVYALASSERLSAFAPRLQTAFDEAGLDVPDAVIDCFAVAILEDFMKLTPEEDAALYVSEFFQAYAAAYSGSFHEGAEALSSSVYSDKTVSQLSKDTFAGALAEIFKAANSIPVSSDNRENELSNAINRHIIFKLYSYSDEECDSVKAQYLAAFVNSENLEKTAGVCSSVVLGEAFDSLIVTVDDIVNAVHENDLNYDTLDEEAKYIQEVIKDLVTILDILGSDDLEGTRGIMDAAPAIGALLDALKLVPTVGTESTAKLFAAVLQVEAIRHNAELTTVDAAIMASKLNSVTADYTKTFKTVAIGMDLATSIQKGELTPQEEIKELINNITPESSEMIKTYVTPERLSDLGISEEKSEATAGFVAALFDNMAESADADKDSEAVKHLFTLATESTKTNDGDSMLFGEDEELGTAESVIETIMTSESVKTTIVNELTKDGEITEETEDPFGIKSSVSDEDIAALSNAANSYYANNATGDTEADALLKLELDALLSLFGVTVTP